MPDKRVNPQTMHPLFLVQTHTRTQRNSERVFAFFLIADFWSQGPELALAILSSFPSWTGSLRRQGNQPPLDWGRLVPPLLIA